MSNPFDPVGPYLLEAMQDQGVPGVSVAVTDDHGHEWAWTHPTDLGSTTRFQAASISKVATALLTLRLHEHGVMDLDDDINSMLAPWELQGGHRVTVLDVLGHTGGLNVPNIPGVAREAGPPPGLWQRVSGQAGYERVVSLEAPGTQWRYSGGGYALLQLALQLATDTPYEDLLRNLVLNPLGMADSGADPGADFAVGHDAAGRVIPGGFMLYPELAAAGLWTTPTDLVRLWRAVVAPGYLSNSSRAVLLKGRLSRRSIAGMTSVTRAHPQVWHAGSNSGYRAMVFGYCSSPHQVAAVMVNSDAGAAVIDRLLPMLADALDWPEFEPPE